MTSPPPEHSDSGAAERLRVLIVVHQMRLGGSQLNATDLAVGMHERGHDVIVAGPPGPLVEPLTKRGVRFEPLEKDEPGRAVARAVPGFRNLLELTRRVRPDLVHTYELTPSILTYLGAHRMDGVPMTMTINSMSVPDFMPGSVPLQVCNPVIAHRTARRPGPLGVLEIPTDCVDQYPGRPGGAEFRAEIGVEPDDLMIVVVSRFARTLKQAGLETAIRVAGRIDPRHRARLVLVGDGPAMPDLRRLAAETNAVAGREVVILTGPRLDPRPAYAAADIALGMGGSILRAMAFGKPCIVQGEDGFFKILDEQSVRAFRWHGFYGIGPGGSGQDLLLGLLERMLGDAGLRRRSGEFALQLVRRYYSLERALDTQLSWYQHTLAEPTRPGRGEVRHTVLAVSRWLAGRVGASGVDRDDFFNSAEHIAAGIHAPIPSTFEPDPTGNSTATQKLRSVRSLP